MDSGPDAERRSLAMTGSGEAIFDWNVRGLDAVAGDLGGGVRVGTGSLNGLVCGRLRAEECRQQNQHGGGGESVQNHTCSSTNPKELAAKAWTVVGLDTKCFPGANHAYIYCNHWRGKSWVGGELYLLWRERVKDKGGFLA